MTEDKKVKSEDIESELIIKQNLQETLLLIKINELVKEPETIKLIVELMETAERNGFVQGYETALNEVEN